MFMFTLIVAATNLVLGYALAIGLGWASLPDFGKKPASSQPSGSTHGQ
jgi:hypothetical protein